MWHLWCQLCPETSLKKHVESAHEGKKSFKCDICDATENQFEATCWISSWRKETFKQQIVHSNVFILHELDCKELSVLMVAESMRQAYFLHELIPCVLALHRNPTWKNTWNLFMKERSLFYELKYSMCPFNWVFCVNLSQQIVHSNVFYSSWAGLQRA
jgi:hypothetical protein